VGEDGRLFSEHSMRRGGATQAVNRGVTDGLILQSGNWTSLQTAAQYIDPSVEVLERFQNQLAS